METLFTNAYGGLAAVKSIGKIQTRDGDGPSQVGGFLGSMGIVPYGVGFPSSSTLAQTWSKELAEKVGQTIGQQAVQNGYSGWYAPAVNLHRSPLNGRNYEYYSEDSLLSGEMVGNTVKGANNAGVYTYVKHFINNDGEAGIYRDSVYTWMTEQTLRETYLKPFQMLVQDYDGVGLMTSYNRLGGVWAGGSKALLTNLLRDEWGFKGAVITDYSDHHAYMNGDQSLRAGGTLWMSGATGGTMIGETTSNTYYQTLRQATKYTLYMYLHVRVTNKEYAEASGNDAILRQAFETPILTAPRIVGALTILALFWFGWALRDLVLDIIAIRKRKKEAKLVS